MDPNVCFSELLEAVAATDRSSTCERAKDLAQWLREGGFYPGDGKLRESAVDAFLIWALRSEED